MTNEQINTAIEDLEEDDGWECPTCLRPMPAEIDYECDTCEAKASEHLRVTTMCRLLREVSGREAALIVRNKKLEAERALADRLVKVVEHSAKIIGPPDSEHDSRWVTDDELDDLWNRTQSALAAWKEARND